MSLMNCESCGQHAAAYTVVFTDAARIETSFEVCWICMRAARGGPRPPSVATLPTGGDAA